MPPSTSSPPSSKSLTSLTGTYALNKSLSTASIASILALQGTSHLIRSAIASASVTLKISQPNPKRYTISQTATAAAIPGTTEEYILDGEWRTNKDPFFGQVRGRSEWIGMEEARGKLGTAGDGGEGAGKAEWVNSEEDGEKVILAEGGSTDGKWDAFRIWGFEEIEGERRYTQNVKVWNREGEVVEGKMVYDCVE